MNFKDRGRKIRFILVPVSFMVVGYIILLLMSLPFAKAVAATTASLFFDSKQAKPLGNIFSSAPARQGKSVKLSAIVFPKYGTKFGRLTIPSASIEAELYFGDGSEELKKGVGLYNGSFIPGYGGTALIAGHNHTYFHRLGLAKAGDAAKILCLCRLFVRAKN